MCYARLTLQDVDAPVLQGVPADATVQCAAVPKPAAVTADDTCDVEPQVDLSVVRVDGACADRYTLARTWTATDACGNTASGVQNVVVQVLIYVV